MKVTTGEVLVSQKVTTFECEIDGCTYRTTEERSAKLHFGRVHCGTKKVTVWKATFVFFGSSEELNAWLEALDYDVTIGQQAFTKPGWYSVKYGSQPCSKGCCTDSVVEVISSDDQVDWWRDEIRERALAIRELRKLLNEEVEA